MAGEKKKRPFRKEYLNDFVQAPDGQYVYTGPHTVYAGGDARRRREVSVLWLCSLVPAALLVVHGLLPNGGMTGRPQLLLPYAAELIALFVLVWKLVRATAGGARLRTYVYEETYRQLPVYAAAAAIAACAGLIGIAATLIAGAFEGSDVSLAVFIVSQVMTASGGCVAFRTARKMPWQPE